MDSDSYTAEYAERYLEYLHGDSFEPQARNRHFSRSRLALQEIPFWKSIDLGALLTKLRGEGAELFVNVSLDPDDYHSYLSRIVPYGEKIVLADPIPTLYEWRDRGVVNAEEFEALLDQTLQVLLPLYPLIERGILFLLPQPLLWNNALDKHLAETESLLLSNESLVESLLTDYEEGWGKQEVIQRWLDANSEVPAGWRKNPEAFAQVNIISGELNDLVNGVMLGTFLGGNITTSSVNTWHHIQKAMPTLSACSDGTQSSIAEILPLTDLPYLSKPDWSALAKFRQNCSHLVSFRKVLHQICRDLQAFGPVPEDSVQLASHLSQALHSQIAELQAERQRLFLDFQPALAKSLIAGASALLGNQPLAVAFAGLAFFDACKSIRNFKVDTRKMKKNALVAVFAECSKK